LSKAVASTARAQRNARTNVSDAVQSDLGACAEIVGKAA
jgi:uncharacterized protein involved in tolerance to divalent cations